MTDSEELHTTRTGPWGTLEYYDCYLDSPEHHFTNSKREVTEWGFVGFSRQKAEDFLAGHGLSVTDLNRDCQWLNAQNGTILRPSHRYVEQLTLAMRQAFYPALLDAMDNASHLNEFVIESSSYRKNARGLNIPENIVNLVETRSVKIGKKTVFTETAYLLSLIPDAETKINLLRSLARNRMVVAKLQVPPRGDVEKIGKWWKAGPNSERVMPVLENALNAPGGDGVDLIHLLPPVPRQLLYTFPSDFDEFDNRKPDCYWAAMNFFSETVSNRYLDSSIPREYYFLDRFKRMPNGTSPRFGDAMVIADRNRNRFVHAFVYIAADLVFTKNGRGKMYPYILMRRDDMLSRYLDSPGLQIEIFRLKNLN